MSSDTGNTEIGALQDFSPRTRGYDMLAHSPIDTQLTSNEQRLQLTKLASLPDTQRQSLLDVITADLLLERNLRQTDSFYTAFMDGAQYTGFHINPRAKPFVHYYNPSPYNDGKHTESAQTFLNAEALTQGDSGTYGLCAVEVSDNESRAALYNTLATAMSSTVIAMSELDLQSSIRSVFCNTDSAPGAPAIPGAYIFVQGYQRTDLFPGYVYDPARGQVDQSVDQHIGKWAYSWKQRALRVHAKLEENRSLNLEDVKDIELISHLFRVEEVIPQIADRIAVLSDSQSKVYDDTSFIKITPYAAENEPSLISITPFSPEAAAQFAEQSKLSENPIDTLSTTLLDYARSQLVKSGTIKDVSTSQQRESELRALVSGMRREYAQKGRDAIAKGNTSFNRIRATKSDYYASEMHVPSITSANRGLFLRALGLTEHSLEKTETSRGGKMITVRRGKTPVPGVSFDIYPTGEFNLRFDAKAVKRLLTQNLNPQTK